MWIFQENYLFDSDNPDETFQWFLQFVSFFTRILFHKLHTYCFLLQYPFNPNLSLHDWCNSFYKDAIQHAIRMLIKNTNRVPRMTINPVEKFCLLLWCIQNNGHIFTTFKFHKLESIFKLFTDLLTNMIFNLHSLLTWKFTICQHT